MGVRQGYDTAILGQDVFADVAGGQQGPAAEAQIVPHSAHGECFPVTGQKTFPDCRRYSEIPVRS